MNPSQLIRLLLLAMGFGWHSMAVAQKAPTSALQFDLSKDIAEQILSLDELYELALLNSPAMREQKAQLDIQTETNRLSRLTILNGVGASAGYSQGNQSLLASGTSLNSTENIQVSNGYRLGVQVNISLANVLGYRAGVRQGQAAYRLVLAKQDAIKISLRREISQIYQALLTNQRILNAYIQEEQKAVIVQQTAEIDWRNGRLDAEEYAGKSSRYTDVHIKTETARGTVLSNLYDLSALVGVEVARLRAQ